jgi:hypothetical protein
MGSAGLRRFSNSCGVSGSSNVASTSTPASNHSLPGTPEGKRHLTASVPLYTNWRAAIVFQGSSSCKSDCRLFLARLSLERYTIANRLRQSRLLHLSLDLSNDLARDLNPALLFHHEILSLTICRSLTCRTEPRSSPRFRTTWIYSNARSYERFPRRCRTLPR